MAAYQAPLEDMQFLLKNVFEVDKFWSEQAATSDFSIDLATAILEEAGKLSRDVLYPLFRSGDEEGCQLHNGEVTTPQGFKKAYKMIAEGGWCGLGGNPEYGGQGLPKTLVVLFEEMLFAANNSLALYPILSAGGAMCLMRHGSDALKQKYLAPLYSGKWSSAMGLTEPHCGTDLGIMKAKAVPNDDGSFAVTGTKIFITGGEHDLCENIVHLVLAKTPNAPAGSRGISLFICPKFFVDDHGHLGERNTLSVGSIEHKMGIQGSATCVMNFDGAKGWLVGEENKGLAGMFTMMNYERLSIGLQGLGSAEMAYQLARDYALDRTQGRAATGVVEPTQMADPIIHHADVRRMLLSVRAFVEGGRAFGVYLAQSLDVAHFSSNQTAVTKAQDLIALLIPVAKAFLTDIGLEACVNAQQVFGGHGYIREWGVEQLVRDTRIAQIYEGTNGIQALDLMGRKIVKTQGELLKPFYADIEDFCNSQSAQLVAEFIVQLKKLLEHHKTTTQWVIDAAHNDLNEVGAASVDYLHFTGYLGFAFVWAKMAAVGLALEDQHAPGNNTPGKNTLGNNTLGNNKVAVAQFFYQRMLPRAYAHAEQLKSGAASLYSLGVEDF